MMCVIIDVNLAFRIFTSVPEADFRPVFDWLHAPDKNGCLVFGGKLFKELANREASRRYLRSLLQAVELIGFLMPWYNPTNNRSQTVDFVSRTILTLLPWHVSVVQGPYALTTGRYIRTSVIPSSSQSREGACIKAPRIYVSSGTIVLVLEAPTDGGNGDHNGPILYCLEAAGREAST